MPKPYTIFVDRNGELWRAGPDEDTVQNVGGVYSLHTSYVDFNYGPLVAIHEPGVDRFPLPTTPQEIADYRMTAYKKSLANQMTDVYETSLQVLKDGSWRSAGDKVAK